MVPCDSQSLSLLSLAFKAIPEGNKLNVLLFLFCRIASVKCDPQALSQAATCFQCIPDGNKMNILLYLACQIANTGEVCIAGGVGPPTIPVPCNFSAYVQQPGPNFGFWLGDMSVGWAQVIAQGP